MKSLWKLVSLAALAAACSLGCAAQQVATSPQVSLPVQSQALVINLPAFAEGITTVPYSAAVTASGGKTPYTWSATGLPPGLAINAATGAISGTPTQNGPSFNVAFTVTDSSNNPKVQTKSAGIAIVTILQISVPNPIPGVTLGTPYSLQFNATGGIAPYTWGIVPSCGTGLPAGLTMSTSGLISGTPPSTDAEGTFTFQAFVKDSDPNTPSPTPPCAIAASPTGEAAALPEGAYKLTVRRP